MSENRHPLFMDHTYCKVELDDIIVLARAVDNGRAEMRDLLHQLDQYKDQCASTNRKPDKDYLPDPVMPFVPAPPPTAKEALEGVTGLTLPPDPIGDLGKKAVETAKEVVGSIGDRVHNLKEKVEETGRELAHDIGIEEA